MKKVLFMLSIFFCFSSYVLAMDTVKFNSCIDGDTIKVSLKDKVYTVRMLAVNTPETGYSSNTKKEYYGEEASKYTCDRIKKAKNIQLEYDSKSDEYDKYGRLLAWVFLDGKLLQEDLVRLGYAKVAYLYDDYKYADRLKEIQEETSAKGIGVWNEENSLNFDPSSSTLSEEDEATSIEVIILGIVFLVVVFISDLFVKIKNKFK